MFLNISSNCLSGILLSRKFRNTTEFMKILLVFLESHSDFKYQLTAYIVGEPTMCLAPGHGATAFRQDWGRLGWCGRRRAATFREESNCSTSFIIFFSSVALHMGKAGQNAESQVSFPRQHVGTHWMETFKIPSHLFRQNQRF